MIEPWLTFKQEPQPTPTYQDRICNYSGLLSVEQYQLINEDRERIEEEHRIGQANNT